VNRKVVRIWIPIAALAILVAGLVVWRKAPWIPGHLTIQGATIRSDADPRKQLPISGVQITASDGVNTTAGQSDDTGLFHLALPGVAWPGRTVSLTFRHPDYKPLELKIRAGLDLAGKRLYIAGMEPEIESEPQQDGVAPNRPASVVSNVRVRYTVNSRMEENIGSAVRTFQAINQGNVPCGGHPPCSPDGNWKASTGAITLDAGAGNEFRDARVSCIAGPCPFTRIDASGLTSGNRVVTASALDWSDTATFLLEAEVFRETIASNVRESYPVTFGRTLNFTLPPVEEGVSLEADIDNTPMVFPLGPDLYLSWATCTMRKNGRGDEITTSYRCELKPGYRF
jgi:hypothetical protein